MGNSKSRHAHSGGFSRKHAKLNKTLQKQQQKHQQQHARNNSFGNNNDNMLTIDTFPGQTIHNDSGHYSLYGSMATPVIGQPEFTNGSYHTNLSKPGLTDQPIQMSDSRQQLQYGTRVKRATVVGSGDPGTGTIMAATNNNNNAYGSNIPPTFSNSDFMINNNGPIRNSGTPSRSVRMGISTAEVDSGEGAGAGVGGGRTGGYNANNAGKQEIMYQQQQQQQQQQLYEINKRPSSTLRQPHGRIPTFVHPSATQQQYDDTPVSTFQPYHQYHQHQHMSGAPSTSMGIHRGEDPSLTTMALGPVEVPIAGSRKLNGTSQYHTQQTLRYQQQQQDYGESSYGQRVPSFQGNSHTATNQQSRHTNPETRKRNKDFSYANNTNNNTTTNSRQFTSGNGSAPVLHRASEVFVNAGLLVDTAGASPSSAAAAAANRLPALDQVFARLKKTNPTNPRETDKRERIYRWQDDVASAQTLNPNTDIHDWIIPVVPDELDRPESPYYLDRITYELDLMAPLGKPIRKAIDINCGSGEWAMDIALKYPRAVVYALDPTLDLSRLPQRIPDNCKFKLRDVKDQEGEFDLVHQRLGAFRIQIMEWTPHFAELGRLVKPGGWIQLAESNGMLMHGGVESRKVNRWVEMAALSSGLNPTQMVEALMPTMLGAGMINVECYEYGIPVGDWAGWRGDIAMQWYLSVLESMRDAVIEVNRLGEGIFEEAVELMKMECMTENAELVMKVICAQRPPLTDDLWR